MGPPPFIVLWLARPVILVVVVQHGPGQWRTGQTWPLLSIVAVRLLPLSQVGRSMLAQNMRRTRAPRSSPRLFRLLQVWSAAEWSSFAGALGLQLRPKLACPC